ncbi:ABC transporter permease [Spirochaeta thermophila]|uniref:Putative permease, involved in lipoprotein release n=1 Tax=Winmispira thermophila (strain ATCC 49972 / DSM 6192 / RI 19.B1) TaxID=665571 RepID=E0RNQ9_WINT6|nr:FtsX-like permease family protein [Spirochaeta thermophila]ADN01182.1 putative permease, involved in lipoprotein release [Spirochaeta thermophila DSM 6192]
MKAKTLFSLSLKNLTRYTRRTIITASAVAVGILLFIFVDSILKGAERDSERNLLWYETGSAQVFTGEFWEEKDRLPLNKGIEEPDEVVSFLASKGVKAAPRITALGELVVYKDPYPEDGSLQVRITAVDPVRDPEVFRLEDEVVEGSWFSGSPGEEGVILGQWLAEDLGARVGYPVTLVTRTRDGAYQTMDLTIVGIVATPNPVVNRTGVYLPLDTADFYLDMGGTVTSIALSLPEHIPVEEQVAALGPELAARFPGLTLKTWKDLAPGYVAIAQAKQGGTSMILLLLFVIAAVGISNTMLMSIYERFREIGMMRALGMKESQIGLSFLLEAAGIGFLGALMGVILAVPINYFLVEYGIDYGWLIREMDVGYRIAGAFKGTWDPGSFLTAFVMGVLIATVVAVFPVRRAFKKSIVDCLYYH